MTIMKIFVVIVYSIIEFFLKALVWSAEYVLLCKHWLDFLEYKTDCYYEF